MVSLKVVGVNFVNCWIRIEYIYDIGLLLYYLFEYNHYCRF